MVDAKSGESGSGMRDRKMHKEVLESEQYPEISFRPDRVEGKVASPGKSSVKVHGMFRIHGVDREITVPAETEMFADHWTATIHFTVPYEKWGMKNPSNFFLKVSDSVEIDLSVAGSVVTTRDCSSRTGSLAVFSVAVLRRDSLSFSALVTAAGREALVFFGPAARPIDHDPVDAVAFLQPEGHGQFGLR